MSVAGASLPAQGQTPSRSRSWEPTLGHAQIPLWPGKVPDALQAPKSESVALAEEPYAGRPWNYVSNVSRPTITVYSPVGQNTGAAVIVFPGGGYQILAIDLEGTEICDWLTSHGITCVLLKYRVPDSGMHWDAKCECQKIPRAPTALQDAQRAMGLVRLHAAEWNIDPHKIGVMGFSAGGHLVAAISTHYRHRLYPLVDEADKQSCRPDFAVVLYPGHLWINPKEFELNPDIQVTRDTPPTFIVQAEDDAVDNVNHSLVYYRALKDASAPVEMHLYAKGGHAFGLRRPELPLGEWPELMQKWLQNLGMLPK